MWQGSQNPCAVARIFFKSAAAPMRHAGIHMAGVSHDLMTGLALDVGDKSNAARVFLKCRVIQSRTLRKACLAIDSFVFHWLRNRSKLVAVIMMLGAWVDVEVLHHFAPDRVAAEKLFTLIDQDTHSLGGRKQ